MKSEQHRHRGAEATPAQISAVLWGSWLAIILILGLIYNVTGFYTEGIGYAVVLIHAVLLVSMFAALTPRFFALVLSISLFIRVALTFWDIMFQHIFTLPNSGVDSTMYHYWAMKVYEQPSYIFEDIRGGLYSKAVGLLFTLTGPHAAVAQYFNVLFGISIVLIVYSLLQRMTGSTKVHNNGLTLLAFLPNTLILSSVFLRETVIAFLVTWSLAFFVRWFIGETALLLLPSFIAILIAAAFHAGIIAVGFGYALTLLFYHRKTSTYRFRLSMLPKLIVVLGLAYMITAAYPDVFLGKFDSVETIDDIYDQANFRAGESTYLTSLQVDNYRDFLLYAPVRALYFLGAPVPWDFRGVQDIFAFTYDSTFYIGTVLLVLRNRKTLTQQQRALVSAAIVIIAVTSLVFGVGVNNAGSAIRHRFKLSGIFMFLFALAVRRRSQHVTSRLPLTKREIAKEQSYGYPPTGL